MLPPKYEMSDDEDVKLHLEVTLLEPAGKPPMPRYQHAAVITGRYLIITGGRNDAQFYTIKNIALNDVCLYDIEANKWDTLALHGFYPSSRWGHSMCLVSPKEAKEVSIITDKKDGPGGKRKRANKDDEYE
jgi:hypothetical protein